MASDSSSSTTPMILTPDSTGNGSPDSPALKKSRRGTAFYPNMNSTNKPLKPFSRSAAKRESVMALGSIEHLQHYFTKTGLVAKKNPLDKPHYGLVPAIGGLSNIPTGPSPDSLSEFHLPPSPAMPPPTRAAYQPVIKSFEINPETLLPGAIEDLIAVARAWHIDGDLNDAYSQDTGLLGAGSPSSNTFDVLDVLKTTTRAIRSIRNYLMSLPDEDAGTIRAQFRPQNLGPGSKQQLSTNSVNSSPDPLSLIRKSALEVLTVLRALEEHCRLPLNDDAYDAHSDGGGSRGVASPENSVQDLTASESLDPEIEQEFEAEANMSFSLVQVQGRFESVPVWEDEDKDSSDEEEREREKEKERWDEKLVLGNGWLYRQDIRLIELGKERSVVGSYLDVVDEVLFGGKKDNERGWERERKKLNGGRGRRRVSTGDLRNPPVSSADRGKRRVSEGVIHLMKGITLSEEPQQMEGIGEEVEEEEEATEGSVDEDELPPWARKVDQWNGNELGRVHALLSSCLPPRLVKALPLPESRAVFLSSLSSGQLLCVAYNACVRRSNKPWGFVSKDGIHDILALEEKAEVDKDTQSVNAKTGWTFRRTDNLRLWAGALKLRYMLPIQVPSQLLHNESSVASSGTPLNSPGPSMQRFPRSREPPLLFDAKIVARKDDGWEEMLEAVVLKWAQKVVEETRSVV